MRGKEKSRRKRDPESRRSEVIPAHHQVRKIPQIRRVSQGKGSEENKVKLRRRIRRR